MVFNITKEGSGLIVASNPILYCNLNHGRQEVLARFQSGGAVFEKPQWTEDKFSCNQREGYWNRLQFRQLGQYAGRKTGIFGSTSGIPETFCGPREIGETIIIEATIRKNGKIGMGIDPYEIIGRNAIPQDKGNIVIAFLLPHQVSQSVTLEELFEQEVTHTEEIKKILAA